MIDETRAPIGSATATPGPVYLAWGGIVAGALAASALSFILLSFGTAIGLALNSPSASWRDTSVALGLLTGVWLLLTALASYGLAGYLAGRLRPRWGSAVAEELDFRDGVQGLLAWALATLIAAVLGLALANRAVPQAANSALSPTSSTVEPLLAFESTACSDPTGEGASRSSPTCARRQRAFSARQPAIPA